MDRRVDEDIPERDSDHRSLRNPFERMDTVGDKNVGVEHFCRVPRIADGGLDETVVLFEGQVLGIVEADGVTCGTRCGIKAIAPFAGVQKGQ